MTHVNRVWHELNLIQFLCFSLFRFCELCKHRFEFAPSKSLLPSLSLSRPHPPYMYMYFSLLSRICLHIIIVICCPTLSSLSNSVYRHDMPQRLPVYDIIGGITWGTISSLRRWCHLGFVAFMWLILVPICICECPLLSTFGYYS